MRPRLLLGGLLLTVIALATTAYLASAGRDEPKDVHELIARSREVMREESFSHRLDVCPLCPPPVITLYAPPDRIMRSGSKGHDDWPYYLLTEGGAYVSQAGERWIVEFDNQSLFLLLSDPRFLLAHLSQAQLEGRDVVAGRDTTLVVGRLDARAVVDDLSREFTSGEDIGHLPDVLDGTGLRFWIDARDYRVLQTKLEWGQPDWRSTVLAFDYDTDVQVPTHVEAMPYEDAQRLGYQAEQGGAALLGILADYRRRHGVYPPALDQATVSDVTQAWSWPTNPFSGAPMQESASTPGDFTYAVKHGGGHFELTVFGWDGVRLYFDTTRFGHPGER